jgi:hypothetical protein
METTAAVRMDAGRVLQAGYVVFAVAATGRSAVQLAVHGSEAPVPYVLSAFAGLVYIAGFLALRRSHLGRKARRIAGGLCVLELLGVAAVGLCSVLLPAAFPDDTVWSGFGGGYGYVPAVLPVLALWWLKAGSRISR